MYINGNEFSSAYTSIMLGGVPFTFESLDWKLKKLKKQNKANFNKVVSVTYGAEAIESINLTLTQQQARNIALSATSQKLTDVAPSNLVISMFTGAADKGTVFVLSDFEFAEDGLDSNSPDDPTMKVSVACIASDIQIIKGGA